MKLLYTITAYPPSIGGAQIHTHRLGQILAAENEIQVVSFWNKNRTDWLIGTTIKSEDQPSDYEIDDISVHLLGFSFSEKLINLPWVMGYYGMMGISIHALSRLIEKHLLSFACHSDIIHNIRVGREPISYASYNAARKFGIPFVLSPLHHPRWSGWRYRYFQQLYREADALIALTSAEKEALVNIGVREERIFITGIGPVLAKNGDGEGFKSKHSIKEQPIVLFLGQKYPYKGIDILTSAAKLVWEKIPQVLFIFAGPRTPYSRKFFLEINDPRIIELESLDLQEKTDALEACTILCLPSSQESFGGVFTEAWWTKKPVIGCRIPAVESVIADGKDGFLTSRDSQELSDKILVLLQNPQLAKSFGNAGRKKVEQNFTWQKLAEKTMAAYSYVLGENKSS